MINVKQTEYSYNSFSPGSLPGERRQSGTDFFLQQTQFQRRKPILILGIGLCVMMIITVFAILHRLDTESDPHSVGLHSPTRSPFTVIPQTQVSLDKAHNKAHNNTSDTSSTSISENCSNTIDGKNLISDSNGFVCNRRYLNTFTGCCDTSKMNEIDVQRFSCESCNTNSKCCSVYEFCVSCCYDEKNVHELEKILATTSNPTLRSSSLNRFDFCRLLCRTSSASVKNENQYVSNLKYCYTESTPPSSTTS